MKLAEALILRADYQTRIEQLKARLLQNVRVQEGDQPAENPAELLQELDRLLEELRSLIQRINRTNSTTPIREGLSLADALAQRDVLGMKQKIYRELAQGATVSQQRFTRSEVKFVSMVNVGQMQRQADQFAKEFRELDTQIQSANWLTELL